MTYEQAEAMVRGRLSEHRLRHTLNVKEMALRLARRYGADEEKAAMAAILHDAAKEISKPELLRIMRDNAIIAKGAEKRPAPVWHGVCAAILARTEWGVEDEENLSAIACHTTGKAGMTRLDKIIFLADMISAERSYPGVEELRALAMEDLDAAMIRALTMTIQFVEEKQAPVDEESRRALRWLQENTNQGNSSKETVNE